MFSAFLVAAILTNLSMQNAVPVFPGGRADIVISGVRITVPRRSADVGYGRAFVSEPEGRMSGKADKLLWDFQAHTDGAFPLGGLIVDASGAFYGTTETGGENDNGSVFKLARSGGKYVKTILYGFGIGNSGDGSSPGGDLIADANGGLYGTTFFGGGGPCVVASFPIGCGAVYKLTP